MASRLGAKLLRTRGQCFSWLHAAGLLKARLARHSGCPVAVLAYHGVSDAPHALFTSRGRFAEHLEFLSSVGSVISLDRLLESAITVGSNRKSGLRFVLTFDDGYQNVVRNAAPLLRAFQMAAHVYVCPQWIDEAARPWWFLLASSVTEGEPLRLALTKKGICEDRDFLTDGPDALPMRAIDKLLAAVSQEELPALLRSGFHPHPPVAVGQVDETSLATWAELNGAADVLHVGSHTEHHTILGLCRDQVFMHQEVIGARRRIEEMTARPCRHFAYPRGRIGDFDARTRAAVEAAGHRTAVTMREGMAHPPLDFLAIPRFYVGETPVAELAATLSGIQQAWDRTVDIGRRLLGRAGEAV